MLTTRVPAGYRACLPFLLGIALAGCAAKPVLHEFPEPLAPAARPPAAISYTLRETASGSGEWLLRGEQGDVVGGFRWLPAFREADDRAPDRGEDFRRDDGFQDGINQDDYVFRLGATSDSLRASQSWSSAPPMVTVFDAASGKVVGELELRSSFDQRFEGIWRGRRIFWRAEPLPARSVERETPDGTVEDHYPAAQLLQWSGGSDAGLQIHGGRHVLPGEPPSFGDALFDVTAARPLTRRELGDAMVLLFAIRSVQQAAGAASVLREQE